MVWVLVMPAPPAVVVRGPSVATGGRDTPRVEVPQKRLRPGAGLIVYRDGDDCCSCADVPTGCLRHPPVRREPGRGGGAGRILAGGGDAGRGRREQPGRDRLPGPQR